MIVYVYYIIGNLRRFGATVLLLDLAVVNFFGVLEFSCSVINALLACTETIQTLSYECTN